MQGTQALGKRSPTSAKLQKAATTDGFIQRFDADCLGATQAQ
jgi:hypothetical protein